MSARNTTMDPAMQAATGTPPGAVLLPGGPAPEWVMIARTGRWHGHCQGAEVVTAAHLSSALDYFRRHYAAHGAELPIDYHHASVLASEGRVAKAPAAGWIRDMELRAGGTELWARVLWTAEAAAEVAARQFRYLSPVFLFGRPDRVTGEPVPMMVHSVALTNTPFLTELQSLNATDPAATDGGGQPDPLEGGESMRLLDALAGPLGRQPEEVASELGLRVDAEDRMVAEALLANAARARELERRLARQNEMAAALGLPEDADAGAVQHAIHSLKASALAPVLNAVRERLGVPQNADETAVLDAIDALRHERADREAADLVDGAVAQGRIPPSQRAFFLACARDDLEATRECLNALAPLMTGRMPGPSRRAPRAARDLEGAELNVCRQLGLSPEAYLAAAD